MIPRKVVSGYFDTNMCREVVWADDGSRWMEVRSHMDTHVKWVQDAHLPPRDGDEVAPSEYHDAMKALVKENAQLLADLRRVRGAIADYLRPGNDKIADTWAVVEQINKEKMP